MINVHLQNKVTKTFLTKKTTSYVRAAAFLASYGCMRIFQYSSSLLRQIISMSPYKRYATDNAEYSILIFYSKF